MTKKDYELFANELYNWKQKGEDITLAVATCLTIFSSDNSLFKEEKFRQACYEGKHIRKSIKESDISE